MTPLVECIILIGMSKRLQVIVEEAEYREIKRAARRKRLTVSEWVRQSLRTARRSEPATDTSRKLDAVRNAMRHDFPTADIEGMLEEIERGYVAE